MCSVARAGVVCAGRAAITLISPSFKDFKYSETRNLQFRAEAFNLFNHPQFGTQPTRLDVADFSGQITSAGRARELQLALKLTF
jgi:hypothetical protein